MTVAAIVTSYNYAAYLREAIESLLGQDHPFDEVLVVDDGSTDRSVEIAREYEPRVRIIRQENAGQLAAATAAMRATTADYVYLLDSDDVAERHLRARVDHILAARPVKIQFRLAGIDGAGERNGSVFPTVSAGYSSTHMRRDNQQLGFYSCPTTSGNIFAREHYLRVVGSGLELREAADGTPALVAPYLGDVVCLDEVLALYRVHDSNASGWANPTVERLQHELRAFERRWAEACSAVGMAEPPFGSDPPAFVLERAILIACINERPASPAIAVRYSSRIWHSCLPTRSKVVLTAWAIASVVTLGRGGPFLVRARRSPSSRPHAVRQLAHWVSSRSNTSKRSPVTKGRLL